MSYPAGVTNGEGGSRSHAKGTELDPEELDAIADPGERRKKIEQYMDELYKLDYEDMVGVVAAGLAFARFFPLGSVSADDLQSTAWLAG